MFTEMFRLPVVGGLALLFFVGCTPAVKPSPEEAVEDGITKPPISEHGPQPKLVIDEPEHYFGAMMVGAVKKHTFVVHNKGEAPLLLKIGAASCGKCSKFTLTKEEVAPGDFAEVQAEWFPQTLETGFRKYAPLYSNDANHRETQIAVKGEIRKHLELDRGTRWEIQEFREGSSSTIVGRIYSTVIDKFEILDLEIESDKITAKATPFTEKDLSEYKAKSGYKIEATVSSDIPIGQFSEAMVIKTNIADLNLKTKEQTDFRVYIMCTRSGPFRIISKPGTQWIPDAMVINMANFPASQGKKAGLIIFVTSTSDIEAQFEEPEVELDFVKVTIERDKTFKVKQRQLFRLNVEIPPNSPTIDRSGKKAMKVKIKSNHPDVPEFNFRISFLAT